MGRCHGKIATNTIPSLLNFYEQKFNPNWLNVAFTRARKKPIVVGMGSQFTGQKDCFTDSLNMFMKLGGFTTGKEIVYLILQNS